MNNNVVQIISLDDMTDEFVKNLEEQVGIKITTEREKMLIQLGFGWAIRISQENPELAGRTYHSLMSMSDERRERNLQQARDMFDKEE